jgi:hypothetical protein
VKQFRTIYASVALHLPKKIMIQTRRMYHPMSPLQEGLLSPNLILGNQQLQRSIPRVKTEDGTCSRLLSLFSFFYFYDKTIVGNKKRSTDCVP